MLNRDEGEDTKSFADMFTTPTFCWRKIIHVCAPGGFSSSGRGWDGDRQQAMGLYDEWNQNQKHSKRETDNWKLPV